MARLHMHEVCFIIGWVFVDLRLMMSFFFCHPQKENRSLEVCFFLCVALVWCLFICRVFFVSALEKKVRGCSRRGFVGVRIDKLFKSSIVFLFLLRLLC